MPITGVFVRTGSWFAPVYQLQNGTTNGHSIVGTGSGLQGGTYIEITPPAAVPMINYDVKFQRGTEYSIGTTSQVVGDQTELPVCIYFYQSGGRDGIPIKFRKKTR